MTAQSLRSRYVSDAIGTASPARLLTMLYDRLVLDLTQTAAALRADDLDLAARTQRHAEDILIELRATLDFDAWPAGHGLAELYGFLLTELAAAGARHDADRVDTCLELIEPLRQAWHTAAAELAVQAS